MNRDEIEEAISECGYVVYDNKVFIGERGSKKLADIKEKRVEITYGDYRNVACIDEQLYLVACLEEYEVPYVEFLDREDMGKKRMVRTAKRNFKAFMTTHAGRILNLVERIDDFKFK